MDRMLLTSLSHQLAAYRSMDVIANNIANASTPGFQRETMHFQEFVENAPQVEGEGAAKPVHLVQDMGSGRDLRRGAIDKTDAPYDFAINGPGYFTVKTAAGDRYTRNGHFTLDSEGRLATGDGDLLQGEGGEIAVTSDDGDIHVAEDGVVTGAKGQIGKLRVVDFDDERRLKAESASLYTTAQTPKTVEQPGIKQGELESSNVSSVVEISHMLEVMRAYQMSASMTQSHEELMRQAIDKLGSTPN